MSISVPSLSPARAPAGKLARLDFGHAVRFYSDDVPFFDELTDFVRSVLRTREPVILVTTEEHRSLIRQMLTDKACDPEQAPLLLLDVDSTLDRFMVDNQPDPSRFRDMMLRSLARARGGYGRNQQRVTIFGEMVAVLWSRGNPKAALALEELWNDLAQTQRFSLICAYPARLFEGSEHWDSFASVCGSHSAVLPDESYGALQSDDERLRAITELQLKVRSLESERLRHKELENHLQSRIDERTAEIEQTRLRLEDLSGRLVHLGDQESQRIARELHDSTAQLLSVLSMYVDLLDGSKESFSPTAAQLISRSNALVKQVLVEVRALSHGLYPPTLDIIGLASALEWYSSRFTERTGIPLTLEIPEAMERLPQPVEMAMFRIAQESLAKIYEHAPGARATIRVNRSNEGATLSVIVAHSGSSGEGDRTPADIFRSAPGEIQERVRHLKGRVFTVSDAGTSGVSVFFPCEPAESSGGDSMSCAG
jgi:signal transduction histidine kinase